MAASFLKWPKKHSSSVLANNQDEDLLDGHPVDGAAPHTPPTANASNGGRSKRSNSLYNMFHRDTAVEQPATDAPTPNRHSHGPISSNQDDNDLKTPSLLQPDAQPTLEKKPSNKFLQGTNKWLESTKRRFSTATTTVLPRRGSSASSPLSDRHVGEAVHTAGGAGVVEEVKADGSAVVRLVSTEYVNCSMVIVEVGGEIEPLPALPQDTVITADGVGTATAYNPKTKEFTVELLDNTTHTFSIDQVHPMEKDADDVSTASTLSPQPDAASGTSLRSSFLQKMAKATPKFPTLLKSRSTGGSTPKYHAGQAVLTQFGDGVVVEVQQADAVVVVVVQLSFGATAYLQVDAIKQGLKASVGDLVQTRFGQGVVAAVAEESVFVVTVNGEDMYVHASEVTKVNPSTSSRKFLHLFKK